MAVTHPEEVAVPAPAARRAARAARVAFLAAVLLGGVAALLAIAWAGYERAYQGRVFPGVTVAGLDLSGRTPADVEAVLAPLLAERFGGTVEVRVGGRRFVAAYATVGRAPDVASTVQAVMAIGRTGPPTDLLAQRLAFATGGRTVEPVLAFDREALDGWIAGVAESLDRPARGATVDVVGPDLRIVADTLGRRLDRGTLAARLAPSLADPSTGATLQASGRMVPIEAALTDVDALLVRTTFARLARPVELVLGGQHWVSPASRVRTWLEVSPSFRGPFVGVNVAAARPDLATLARKARLAPRETRFLVTKSGRKFGFVAGRPGRQLDLEGTIGQLIGHLGARRLDVPAVGPVQVATRGVELKLTAEAAAKVVPQMVRLSTWTTHYPVGPKNGFGANITIPARIIDGTVVRPGAVFDFWRAIGPLSSSRGFRMGGVIVGGHTVAQGAMGGGICSASTTLFNAAARAGLQILERDNHFYYITRYPLGLDATVLRRRTGSVQNMRFRNDTSLPIFISGQAGPGWIRFEMYALQNTRVVQFSRPRVWNVVRAGDRVVRTTALRAGQAERLEWPANGMDVLVVRTVRDLDGHLIHRDVFRSHYGRVDGILRVGIR